MHDISTLSLGGDTSYQRVPFGKEMLKHFQFDPKFKNMNHGSFGSFPNAVRKKAQEFRDQVEARPDPFIRYTYPKLLDEARDSVSKMLNVHVDTIVFIPNATTGVGVVLRNLVWNADGKDEIFYFNTVYGACGKAVDFTCEASMGLVKQRRVNITYPIEDSALVETFKKAIQHSRAAGQRPRLAIFDTVSSMPGVRMPFEELTATCRTENILSMVDGAHGVGHLPLDLTALNPDFFVSNCHKWLFVPRGCAIFHVPVRNQALIRSTMPTSHGFISRDRTLQFMSPLPVNNTSSFVANFEFVGTLDNTPYLCVPEAIKWRQEVAGGEEAIHSYCETLVRDGAKKIAEILGTEVLDNATQTMTKCSMINVRLPLVIAHENTMPGLYAIKPGYGTAAKDWLVNVMMAEYDTFMAIYYFQEKWWVRMSGQVYLDMEDFEWAAWMLKELCERVGKGEYLAAAEKLA